MQILWHSNSPLAPTGYGQQTATFAPLLAEHRELTISTNYGLEGAPIVWRGIPVLPGLGGSHGNETLPGHVNATFGPDARSGLLLTLYDTPVFDPGLFARLSAACWTPVDHDPVPPAVTAFFRSSQAIPIAMSRFGEEQLGEFDPIYVPHGIDLEVFRPRESNVRELMGVPDDAFLVGIVAANKGRPSRKCFQQAFEAFRELRRRREDAYLYVHTTVDPTFASGEDLLALAASLELPNEAVKFPNQYAMMFSPFPPTRLAETYSAMDVLLNVSAGEGFGVPVAEAQACGTPVVVTDFSAMKEVAGPDSSWRVGGRPYWTGQASWMAIPDVPAVVEALEDAYSDRAKLEERGAAAVEHAAQYDARTVFDEHLLPAVEEVEARLGDRAPVELKAAA